MPGYMFCTMLSLQSCGHLSIYIFHEESLNCHPDTLYLQHLKMHREMLHSCPICSHKSNYFWKIILFLLKVAQGLQPRHILPVNSILRITNLFLNAGAGSKAPSWLTAVTIRKQKRNFCIQKGNFGCHILFHFVHHDFCFGNLYCRVWYKKLACWNPSHTINLNILRRKNECLITGETSKL